MAEIRQKMVSGFEESLNILHKRLSGPGIWLVLRPKGKEDQDYSYFYDTQIFPGSDFGPNDEVYCEAALRFYFNSSLDQVCWR